MTFTIFLYLHFYFPVLKVFMSKLMMLVAAKWRDFSASIPDTSLEEEANSSSLPLRSSHSTASSGRKKPELSVDEEDGDDELPN